jgi:hypothetical protein
LAIAVITLLTGFFHTVATKRDEADGAAQRSLFVGVVVSQIALLVKRRVKHTIAADRLSTACATLVRYKIRIVGPFVTLLVTIGDKVTTMG